MYINEAYREACCRYLHKINTFEGEMYINEAYREACCRYLHKINTFEVLEQLHFSDAYTFEEIEKEKKYILLKMMKYEGQEFDRNYFWLKLKMMKICLNA